MALAVREDRVLISADTDFSTLLATQRALKPSLILLRTSTHHPQMQLTLLLDSLPGLETGLKAGCVVVFEGFRTRIRYLPILR